MPRRPPTETDPSDLVVDGEELTPAPLDIEDLVRAVRRLWPARKAPDEILALADRIVKLEQRPDLLCDGIAAVEEEVTAMRERAIALKERVDKSESRRWWLITFIAGAALTVAAVVYRAGSLVGDMSSRIHQLEQRLDRRDRPNRSWPGVPAEEPTP